MLDVLGAAWLRWSLGAWRHTTMSRTIVLPLLCASLAFAVAGCYTVSRVNFGNGTGQPITVTSAQTGQEIHVPPGKFKELPHAAGDLTVRTQTNGTFRFPEVSPPRLDAYLVKGHSLFGAGHVTLSVVLKTNMQLYVLMPLKGVDRASVPQPEGYPRVGTRIASHVGK